jgi:hypothetical protein
MRVPVCTRDIGDAAGDEQYAIGILAGLAPLKILAISRAKSRPALLNPLQNSYRPNPTRRQCGPMAGSRNSVAKAIGELALPKNNGPV